MRLLKIFFKVVLYAVVALVGFVVIINLWVYLSTSSNVHNEIDDLPASQVALVLGTSHRLMNGLPNPFFHERMKTAANLYNKGIVKHILVSGDNATIYYNEPHKMRQALMKLGVPSESITLDYAGFRTLDSIVRCKKVFGQDNIIIITQPFHSYRALFISDFYDIDAVAMTTNEVEASINVQVREYLARTLAVWDLYIIKKEPKFLGKKETLEI